jgi:hypothetical protein
MNQSKVIFGLVIVFLSMGCKKSTYKGVQLAKKVEVEDINKLFPGQIRLDLNSQNNVILSAAITGSFRLGTGAELANIGDVSFNGVNLIKEESNLYRLYDTKAQKLLIDLNTIYSLSGKEVKFSGTGNAEAGYLAFTEAVRIPDAILVNEYPKGEVSGVKGFEFNWTQSSVKDQIIAEIEWISAGSVKDQSKVSKLTYTVEDLGRFKLTPEMIKQFDPSGKICVKLSRFVVHEVSANKKIGIVCINTNTIGYFKIN